MFSSLIGFFQKDIKKIIAYSTMSQLGMMVLSIGLSCYNLALFHLINHAFYKALLFLGAGSVIHAMMDNQDLRKYGGLKLYLPLTYSVILIASFSLIAIPFMSGFYSKDLFIGIGTDFFLDNSIFIHYLHEISIDTEFVISTYIKILPFIITISLMFIYIYKSEYKIFIFINSNNINIIIYNIFCFFNQRFFIEFIYNKYISEYLLDIGSDTTKFLDKGSVEYIGPYGLEKSLIYLSETLSKLDTGRVNFYSLFILCGLIIYIYI